MNLRRKRLRLMRDTQWRGYLRTASGNPLTLQAAKRLRQLTIYGNAVQDGTPTPDNPIDVQLCGDRILPLGYTAVEYIEGTGTQWIDTDIGSDENTGMYLEAALTEVLQNLPDNGGKNFLGIVRNNFLIGYSNNNDLQDFRFSRKKGVGVTLDYNFATPLDTNKHTFQNNYLNNHKFVLDEESVDAPDAEFKNTLGMAIFRTMFGTTLDYYNAPIKAKIYRLKISQDTDIIVDIYPAKRDSDGVVGMYDIIQDKFYTNSGTGKFIAGNGICASYKVSGHVEGLNLLSSAWEEGDININTGENSTRSDRIRTIDHIKCKPNTVYTFYTPYSVIGVRGYDSDKTHVSFFVSEINNSTVTFTTNGNVEYLRFITQSSDGTVPDMTLPYMLVQGAYTAETMPAYEPYREPQTFNIYTPQQLAKAGKTADEVVVDFEKRTAELRKNVGSAAFTGDEDWYTTREPTDTQNYFVSNLTSKKVNEALSSLSSHFVSTTANILALNEAKVQSFIHGTAWYGACVDSAVYPDIASFKQFVTEQYSKGNPLTVYHAIEPVTTDITSLQQWDAMPQVKGTVTLTLSAEVEPSGAEAVYYSKERSTE